MKHFFTRNIGWKLLSLAIALVLWISVAREPEVASSVSVPIEFKNPPSDLDIEGALPDRVRIEVRGSSGRLTRDNLSGVAVVLDLSDAQPGERTYNIRRRNLNLPGGVSFDKANPSQVTLRFERLVMREEPVQPVYVNLPDGYRVASASVHPTAVKIRGSEERVAPIHIIKTDPINLAGSDGEKSFRTHLNIGDPQVRLMDAPADITVEVTLEKSSQKGAH
jgi:YbbR domain-containing protein